MKTKLFLLSLLATGLMCGQVNANKLTDPPPLPSHEEFLQELVEEGHMTPEEAKEDLALAEEHRTRVEHKKEIKNSQPTDTSPQPQNISVEKSQADLVVGEVFTPQPAKRKIAGTNRSMTSALPVYALHDGEYLIPLIPQIILNGVITPNGYYYTVTGVRENFFKLTFEKKCTSVEIQEILKENHHPFQIQ